MSAQIAQEFRASGVAQVIVVLRSATAPYKGDLEQHFTESDLSRTGALAAMAASARAGRTGRSRRPARASISTAPRLYPNLGILYGTVDRSGLAALRARTDAVASVSGAPQLSLIRPVRSRKAKPSSQVTWGIQALGVPHLWKQGLTGKGVLVGHLDTGVDGRHPALKGAIAAFSEFDELGHDIRPTPKARDTDEHGTHTAGTIAGREAGRRAIGVAPGAKLASAVVVDGGDTVARVLAGMDWALGQGVRILNLSVGVRGWLEDFLPITRILRARGVLPVFAAGNEGPGTSRSPGNYPEALAVGAGDRNGLVADFSSSQKFRRMQDAIVPDLVGPGVDVVSAKPDGGFQSLDGTSMAAPHIAGLAALLLEAKPAASVDDVETVIFRSCKRPADEPVERANRGMPNGPRALKLLESLQAVIR